jgi:hypothetical protein
VQLEGLTVTGASGISWISGIWPFGLLIHGEAQVEISDSAFSSNDYGGLNAVDSAWVMVWDSLIEENGTGGDCDSAWVPSGDQICNGIEVGEDAHLEVTGLIIRNNHDWGVAAVLEKCGFSDFYVEKWGFTGEVILEDNKIDGNGRGDVCLP